MALATEREREREYEVLSLVSEIINKYESPETLLPEHILHVVSLLKDKIHQKDTLQKLFVILQEKIIEYFDVLDTETMHFLFDVVSEDVSIPDDVDLMQFIGSLPVITRSKMYSAYEAHQVGLFLKYLIEKYEIKASVLLESACVEVFELLFDLPADFYSVFGSSRVQLQSTTTAQPAHITMSPLAPIRVSGGKRL